MWRPKMKKADPKLIKAIQKALVLARTEAGITRGDLDVAIDAPTKNMWRTEEGKNVPSVPTLIAYGKVVGVPAWKILRYAMREMDGG